MGSLNPTLIILFFIFRVKKLAQKVLCTTSGGTTSGGTNGGDPNTAVCPGYEVPDAALYPGAKVNCDAKTIDYSGIDMIACRADANCPVKCTSSAGASPVCTVHVDGCEDSPCNVTPQDIGIPIIACGPAKNCQFQQVQVQQDPEILTQPAVCNTPANLNEPEFLAAYTPSNKIINGFIVLWAQDENPNGTGVNLKVEASGTIDAKGNSTNPVAGKVSVLPDKTLLQMAVDGYPFIAMHLGSNLNATPGAAQQYIVPNQIFGDMNNNGNKLCSRVLVKVHRSI